MPVDPSAVPFAAASVNSRRRRSAWRARASAASSPRPERISISLEISSPAIDSGLHSARTQIFTKSFPRCGVPDAFGSWQAWADYVELLVRTTTILEFTQLWCGRTDHHSWVNSMIELVRTSIST